MMNIDEIDAELAGKAVKKSGLELFGPSDAIALIRKCRDKKFRILGIDAFIDWPDAVQPSMEHSIDFSSEKHAALIDNSWEHAEDFVRTRESMPLLFEIVVEDR